MDRPTDQPCDLFTLPRELQDIIFDLAYSQENDTCILTRSSWRERQKELRREHTIASKYEAKPFPSPKVDDFTVSKQFFVAASRAWVTNKDFCNIDPIAAGVLHFDQPKGIMWAFIRELRCELWQTRFRVDELPALKVLKIAVPVRAFEKLEPEKLAWQDTLDEADFTRVMPKMMWDRDYEPLTMLRGRLQRLECEADRCPYGTTAEEKEVWASNVRALETFLKARIAVGKEMHPTSESSMAVTALQPLYPGSEVRCGTRREQMVARFGQYFCCFGYFALLVLLVFALREIYALSTS